jgi:bacterioferritin
MITSDHFVTLLNGDLMREWAAAIQYKQHAAVINGPMFAFAETVLSAHADEEIGHAEKVMDIIVFLGGVPTVETAMSSTGSIPFVLMQLNLQSEQEAIARYTERIAQARELNLSATESILLGIIADEQHHANDLKSIIGTM